MPIEITDPADDRVSDYFSLTDVNLRKKLEPVRGLYLAESEKVIRRALGAGHRPRSFLMGERWLTDLADLVAQAESSAVPVYVAEAAVIQAMTGFHLHRGALASMHRPVLSAPESLLQNASRIAIFEDIVDHSNLGAAFRSAAALGIDGVLITRAAPTRSTGGRSGSRWGRCFRSRGPAYRSGPRASTWCVKRGSRRLLWL